MTTTTVTNKFQRTYQIQIQDINGDMQTFGSLDGSMPLLTLEFNIKRDTLQGINTANLRIRNINESIRSVIIHDYFDTFRRWPLIIVRAGYVGTPLSIIFQGVAQSVYSYREEGGTDWITEVDATDYSSLINNSFSSWTIGSNTNPVSQKDVISRLVSDLQICGTKYGQPIGVGVVNGFTSPRYTYTANDFTWNILRTETQALSYIDNGKIYIIPNNYVFQGAVTLIFTQTGLLGTPRQYNTSLVAQIIFEPGITPGQQIALDSELSVLNSSKNGTYKVTGLQHAGVISSTISGKCITTVTMQLTSSPFLTSMGLYPTV